jgi:hypothetical protein
MDNDELININLYNNEFCSLIEFREQKILNSAEKTCTMTHNTITYPYTKVVKYGTIYLFTVCFR